MEHTIPSRTTYVVVAVALLILLALTVGLAHVPLGGMGTAVALAIATIKAAIVAVFFMHLKWSSPLTRLFAFAGIVWLSLLIGGSLADYLTRGGF